MQERGLSDYVRSPELFQNKIIRKEGERCHTYLHTSLGELDIEYATPGRIKNFLVKIYDKQSSVAIAGKLGAEGGKDTIFYTRHINKAFNRGSVSQMRKILRIFSGNVHTNQRVKKWGMQEHNTCPFDQEIDTQIHRIWKCKGTPENRTDEA